MLAWWGVRARCSSRHRRHRCLRRLLRLLRLHRPRQCLLPRHLHRRRRRRRSRHHSHAHRHLHYRRLRCRHHSAPACVRASSTPACPSGQDTPRALTKCVRARLTSAPPCAPSQARCAPRACRRHHHRHHRCPCHRPSCRHRRALLLLRQLRQVWPQLISTHPPALCPPRRPSLPSARLVSTGRRYRARLPSTL